MPKQGPSGGGGGKDFELKPPPNLPIIRIDVYHGLYVDKLLVSYGTGVGPVIQFVVGGDDNDNQNHDLFTLSPDERLTGIDGETGGADDDGPYVGDIRFTVTNIKTSQKRQSPSFGGVSLPAEGFFYTAPVGAEVISFFGKAGKYIDAIGIVTNF